MHTNKTSTKLKSGITSPFISVILPIRNEAQYITDCLNSILSQDYPPYLIEVLVVDGMSDDSTRELVKQFIEKEERKSERLYSSADPQRDGKPAIYLLDNPARIVPNALNIGLSHAKGEIIIRVDGHCLIDRDYVQRCVELLKITGADNVGGLMRGEGNNIVGQAVSLATSSPFGVGGARFHYSTKACWVDTVYLGAYRREVFDRIGGFDEELVRNQDDEFNFRLLQAGGRIWLDPSIQVTYYARSNFSSLWRQYFQYGLYKVRVIQKRGQVASWRHLVPAGFVVGLALTAFFSLFTGNYLWSLLVAGPYLLANVMTSLWTARRDWKTLPFLPLTFLTLHLSYGSGFLWGLWRWRRYWKST